jgi:hypothetical protein
MTVLASYNPLTELDLRLKGNSLAFHFMASFSFY